MRSSQFPLHVNLSSSCAKLTDPATFFHSLPWSLLKNPDGIRIAVFQGVQIWRSTMAEGIVSLIILVCAVGGPLLTIAIMTKPKRRRKTHGTEKIFANYFSTTTPQGPTGTWQTQASGKKPAKGSAEQPRSDNVQVRNSGRTPLAPDPDALVTKSERRLLLPPPRRESKS